MGQSQPKGKQRVAWGVKVFVFLCGALIANYVLNVIAQSIRTYVVRQAFEDRSYRPSNLTRSVWLVEFMGAGQQYNDEALCRFLSKDRNVSDDGYFRLWDSSFPFSNTQCAILTFVKDGGGLSGRVAESILKHELFNDLPSE